MNQKERFVSPLIDIVFKTLWMRADDDLKEYFKRILEYALRREIPDYHIAPNETGIVNIDNIANKVDILLESDDEKLDIELNNAKDNLSSIQMALNKSLIYLSYYVTTFYDGVKMSDRYKKMIKVEQINLNSFHCEHNYLVERLDYKLTDATHGISESGIEYHHIYLPRMKELCYNTDIDIYKDFAILMCETYEEMEELAYKNRGRLALINMLKSLGRDDEFMTVIDKVEYEKLVHEAEKEDMKELGFDEGHKEGIEQGIEQGIKQGEEETQTMFIKSMATNNIEISEIAKIANMSIEEVQKIINEK